MTSTGAVIQDMTTVAGDGVGAEQAVIASAVPGFEPVLLHAYYPEFAGYYGACELASKAYVASHLPSDAVVIDAGANVGLYSVLCGRTAAGGTVHAFEPTSTADMLLTNVAAAALTNVRLHRQALSNHVGCGDDAIYRVWGQPAERRTYDFTTVDRFVEMQALDRLDFLKIDVDGFDLEVLEGAMESLERFDPLLMIEVNHALATRGRHGVDVYQALTRAGYRDALVLDKDNLVLRRRGLPGLEAQALPALTVHLDESSR